MFKKQTSILYCADCSNKLSGTQINKIKMLQDIGIDDKKTQNIIQTCNHILCNNCLIKSKNRAKNDTFYKEYIGVCDDCIWFSIGWQSNVNLMSI